MSYGLDIHKRFLIATILGRSGGKKQERFQRNEDGILTLKNWVLSEKFDVVACESTNDFLVPIYDSLKNHLPVIVRNARDMKAFYHKKTDKVDSEYIAKLALNNMIQPSRVFPKNHRDFRSNIRLHHELVQKRTDIKNEAHSILAPEMFSLKKEFFNRKTKSIGHAKAIIVLARKIVTIIWHLITNEKMYEDETVIKREKSKRRKLWRLNLSRLIKVSK